MNKRGVIASVLALVAAGIPAGAAVGGPAVKVEDLTLRAYMDAPTPGTNKIHRKESYSKVLWYNEDTEEYYSSASPYSSPEKFVKLFTFENLDGYPSLNYTTAYLPNGDVLFVYDSQFGGETYSDEEIAAPYSIAIDNKHRRNPIIAVASEGYKLHIIDFGDRLKPTGWLQNIGQHYSFRHKAFYFAEYTRANLRSCNGWKVSGDLRNPDNWSVRASRLIDFPYKVGTKHFHIAQEDPYTGVVYFSTGDRNAGLYASADGTDFVQLDKNDRAKWRMLNAVFTKDYVWWASDDWVDNHRFWQCSRDASGVIDPESLNLIYKFPYFKVDSRATYGNIYFSKYDVIVFLDRWDGGNPEVGLLPVYMYDIKKGEIKKLTDIVRREGLAGTSMWGFRCRTMEMYPTGSTAVVSFDSFHPNELPFGRPSPDSPAPKNLVLSLTRDASGNYHLDITPLGEGR